MHHAVRLAALLLLGTLPTGCIGFPLGAPRVRPVEPAVSDALDLPLVFTGELDFDAPRLGWRVARGALATTRTRAHRVLAPVVPAGPFAPAGPALRVLRGLDPTNPGAYAARASELPPHYVGRYRLLLDASELPDEERLRSVARGHALFGLVFSPLPLHPVRVAARCELELARAEPGREEPIATVSLAGERRLVGNLWWLQGGYRAATRRALEALAADCAAAMRREALGRIGAFRGAQAPRAGRARPRSGARPPGG